MTDIFAKASEFINAGGPIMYLLALLSVFAATIFVSKLFQFLMLQVWRRRRAAGALFLWRSGQRHTALAMLDDGVGGTDTLLRYAMRLNEDTAISEASAREEIERASCRFMERLSSGLPLLSSIATLSPLIGLLGTVIGMIDAFQALEDAGSKVDPSILSGGIWVALLTTAAGLIVAIPATAAHQYLDSVVERTGQGLEDSVSQVFADIRTPEAAVRRQRQPASNATSQSLA